MTGQPLRLIFAGTPDFAAVHLKGILEQGSHEVVAVYSQPDRPAGRGKKLKPSPVKQLALDHGIQVLQPLNFKDQADQQDLADLKADLMVVVAYGLLLPKVILETPQFGCINVHASLLPRWRGAAPIQRAIEAGDEESGVIVMQMDEGLDTGDMLLEARCKISVTETGGSLHDKLAGIGVPALLNGLQLIADKKVSAKTQNNEHSCYAAKISKQELAIDWTQAAAVIERKIRAFNPFPIAYTSLNGERIKIWQASISDRTGPAGSIIHADKKNLIVACGEGSLSLENIQLPGGRALTITAVMNSKADLLAIGTQLD
jgi:methionyl-tRNA formyltransferase